MDTTSYRLIWTKPSGQTITSEPLTRETALKQFDNCVEIRRACSNGYGRLRVVPDEATPPRRTTAVEIYRWVKGCARWVRHRGGCALSAGHDGPCVQVEGRRN